MHVWSVLTARPKPVLPRSQRLVSLAGLFVLAVLLVGHSIALSVFMWQPGVGTKVVVFLVFSWAISLVGVWLVLRLVRAVWSIPEPAKS
jgi:hypothetical protein